MIETKIENQKHYQARIEYFKEKYIKDFKEKVSAPDCDKAYVRDRFKRDVLELNLNKINNTENISEARNFRNKSKWLNGTKTFEAVKQFCEERKPKKDFQFILQSLAEYDAILDTYSELNIDEKERKNQTENKEVQDGNDVLELIKNKFQTFKDAFNNDQDYFKAINFLKTFFLSGKISINEPLFVKSGNIKSIAFALGEIWRTKKNETITYEYLFLYKQLFSIFKNQVIEKNNIFGSNLYKYSISKT